MRGLLVAFGFCLLAGTAYADKAVISGRPLLLYQSYSVNPDCSAAGTVVMRLGQGPEHGRVAIRSTGVFPNFPESNVRSACNRRRVPGVQATYVSQRGYTGPDFVALEVFFPSGRQTTVSVQIQVK